jgi:hypothetical protein
MSSSGQEDSVLATRQLSVACAARADSISPPACASDWIHRPARERGQVGRHRQVAPAAAGDIFVGRRGHEAARQHLIILGAANLRRDLAERRLRGGGFGAGHRM